jgi:hypothetical protein
MQAGRIEHALGTPIALQIPQCDDAPIRAGNVDPLETIGRQDCPALYQKLCMAAAPGLFPIQFTHDTDSGETVIV